MALPRRRTDPVQRFWSKVEKSDGCWLWLGHKTSTGYGKFWSGTRPTYAHRFSLAAFGGGVDDDQDACHRCDNPSCVRPDHLFAASHAENQRDSAIKGRARNAHTGKTHCKRGHEFTPENTRTSPDNHRHCRTCEAAWLVGFNERRRLARRSRKAGQPIPEGLSVTQSVGVRIR